MQSVGRWRKTLRFVLWVVVMLDAEDYHPKADEAETLAETMRDVQAKETYLKMARTCGVKWPKTLSGKTSRPTTVPRKRNAKVLPIVRAKMKTPRDLADRMSRQNSRSGRRRLEAGDVSATPAKGQRKSCRLLEAISEGRIRHSSRKVARTS